MLQKNMKVKKRIIKKTKGGGVKRGGKRSGKPQRQGEGRDPKRLFPLGDCLQGAYLWRGHDKALVRVNKGSQEGKKGGIKGTRPKKSGK